MHISLSIPYIAAHRKTVVITMLVVAMVGSVFTTVSPSTVATAFRVLFWGSLGMLLMFSSLLMDPLNFAGCFAFFSFFSVVAFLHYCAANRWREYIYTAAAALLGLSLALSIALRFA